MPTLASIVATIENLDPELTIYAVEPWSCESLAIVAHEPVEGGIPPEAAAIDAAYLIEVSIASEFLHGWQSSLRRPATAVERCQRLVEYALRDA